MKILLINPNRVLSPPVPPIGLEYLSAILVREGHDIRLLDLTFHDNAEAVIEECVFEFMPDICGLTVRNVDSVLFHNNQFYLDSIRDIVRYLKINKSLKVIIGGAGIVGNPEGILDYLGADYAIAGPAEGVILEFLSALRAGQTVRRVWKGLFRPYSSCPRFSSAIDYRKYYDSGGIAGFETHKGCSSSCSYCIEADSPVAFKKPVEVVQEIRGFVEKGYKQFHLCDAEFNEDLDHAIEFCSALRQGNMNMKWTAYMKPANFNQRLFRLMSASGVDLVTLTIDSFRKCPLYWADAEKIIFSAQANGIRIAVDFLTGFPYEDADLLSWCLDFFRRLQPDRVNINTYIRLYKTLMITKIIERDDALKANILGSRDNKAMILPIFYNHVDPGWLKECISGDRIFKIEGEEQGVNYMRA